MVNRESPRRQNEAVSQKCHKDRRANPSIFDISESLQWYLDLRHAAGEVVAVRPWLRADAVIPTPTPSWLYDRGCVIYILPPLLRLLLRDS